MPDPDLDLLLSVQASEPGAAAPLYDRFAGGVRAILRHKLPDSDVEAGVFQVLVNVACAVRMHRIEDPGLLPAQVRAVTNAYVASAAAGRPSPEDELRNAVDQLGPQGREILARFYCRQQSERQIGREMNVPVERISALRRNLRQHFLARRKR